MAEIDSLDDSISILEDASTAGYQGHLTLRRPQFQLFQQQLTNVDEASHYALKLTCQTLQERNRNLENQLIRINREMKRAKSQESFNSNLQLSELLSSPKPFELGAMSDLHKDTSTATDDFIQFLQNKLSEAQESERNLSSQLDNEKAITAELRTKLTSTNKELDQSLSLVQSRRSELSEVRDENDTLKSVIATMRKELKEKDSNNSGSAVGDLRQRIVLQSDLDSANQALQRELSQSQHLTHTISLIEQEKASLEQTIEEKDKLIRKLCLENKQLKSATGRSDQDDSLLQASIIEIAALQAQITEMQSVMTEQSALTRLLANKLRQRSHSSGSNSLPVPRQLTKSPSIPESSPILCAEDLESLEHEQPQTLRSVQMDGSHSADVCHLADARAFSAQRAPDPFISPPIPGASRNDLSSGTSPMGSRLPVSLSGIQVLGNISGPRQSGSGQTFTFNTQAVIPSRTQASEDVHTDISTSGRESNVRSTSGPDNRKHGAAGGTVPQHNFFIGHNMVGAAGGSGYHDNQRQNENFSYLIQGDKDSRAANIENPNKKTDFGAVVGNHLFPERKPVSPHNLYQGTILQPQTNPTAVVRSSQNDNNDGRFESSGLNPLSLPRSCPLCSRLFSHEVLQFDFELHVDQCAGVGEVISMDDSDAIRPPTVGQEVRSRSQNISSQNLRKYEAPKLVIFECPVCAQVLPPGTTQERFEIHVNNHFDESET